MNKNIPNKIHYCWFGGKELPESAKKCIDSWKKFFPNYEIKEWNESNFDINYCAYTKEAYEAKKWAFVSDVARFKILYENGGLYFDTDVEVIKSFDNIISNGAFMGIENGKDLTIAPGLGLGVEAGNAFYKEMLEFYSERKFFGDNGELDLTTIVEYTTNKLKAHGLKNADNIQTVCGINVYPQEYFNPKDHVSGKVNITERTLSIHHFDGTWYSEREKYALKLKRKYVKVLPKKLAGRLACFISDCKHEGFFEAIKILVRKLKKGK